MVNKLRSIRINANDILNDIIVVGLLIYLFIGNGVYEIQSAIVGGLICCLRMGTSDGNKHKEEGEQK